MLNLFINPFNKEVRSIFFYNYTLNKVAVKQFQAFIEYKKGSLVGLHLFHENGMDRTFRKGVTFFFFDDF